MYFSIITHKKKNNFAKIRTNFHKLHSETRHWIIPKTSWNEKIYHLCDTKEVEDEKITFLTFKLIKTMEI